LAARLAPWTRGNYSHLFTGPTTTRPAGHLVVWSLRALPDELRAVGTLLALDAIWREVDDPARLRPLTRADSRRGQAWARPGARRLVVVGLLVAGTNRVSFRVVASAAEDVLCQSTPSADPGDYFTAGSGRTEDPDSDGPDL
jgi:hypothetical protein